MTDNNPALTAPEKNNSDEAVLDNNNHDNIPLTDLFENLTRLLLTRYQIDRGVLAIRNSTDDGFAAVSTWQEGAPLDGLKLNLPKQSSLFEQVAKRFKSVQQSNVDEFCGNFFEKKLLLDDNSQSYLVKPLVFDGQVVGILGYSSTEAETFDSVNEKSINNMIEELTLKIKNQIEI